MTDRLAFNEELDALAQAPVGAAVEMDLPDLKVLALEGSGHPGSDPFRQGIRDLWRVAYAIQQIPRTWTPPGYEDFAMPPTEVDFESAKRDCPWVMFFPQPSFVTHEVLERVYSELADKGKPVEGDVVLMTRPAHRVVQTTHVGFPDGLPAGIEVIRGYARDHDLTLGERQHEVFIDDPIRIGFETARDLLRYTVID